MPGAEGNPGKTVTTKKTIISRIDTQQNKRYAKTKEILLGNDVSALGGQRSNHQSMYYYVVIMLHLYFVIIM